MKVRKGTRNYLHEAAMTETEMELCLERGAEVVRRCREEAVTYSVSGKWE